MLSNGEQSCYYVVPVVQGRNALLVLLGFYMANWHGIVGLSIIYPVQLLSLRSTRAKNIMRQDLNWDMSRTTKSTSTIM